MEKLHAQFVDGCVAEHGMPAEDAEELFRRCAAFATFGFAKSHAAAFARTAYESSFLKLFYPAQFVTGLINAQPMGFYPVEVLVNDAKRHGVAVLPVDVNRSAYRTTTEWVGRPGWALAGAAGDDGSHDGDEGEPLPEGCGIDRTARARALVRVRDPGRRVARALGRGVDDGLGRPARAAPGQGDRRGAAAAPGRGAGPRAVHGPRRRRGAHGARRGGRGAADPRGGARLAGPAAPGAAVAAARGGGGVEGARGREDPGARGGSPGPPAGRWTCASPRPRRRRCRRSPSRSGWATPTPWWGWTRGARRWRCSAARWTGWARSRTARSPERRPGRVRLGGLVVTRQHPMTARGTVFLALEDETGMVNVTLWPDTWARLRSVVRRHALLLVDGDLQREGDVVNVVAREVVPLVEAAAGVGGPESPSGVRQMGQAGMRRLG